MIKIILTQKDGPSSKPIFEAALKNHPISVMGNSPQEAVGTLLLQDLGRNGIELNYLNQSRHADAVTSYSNKLARVR